MNYRVKGNVVFEKWWDKYVRRNAPVGCAHDSTCTAHCKRVAWDAWRKCGKNIIGLITADPKD